MRTFIASAALVLVLMLGTLGGAVPRAMAAPGNGNVCRTPDGVPIAQVVIAAALLFLPTITDSTPGEHINAAAQQNGGLGHKDNLPC